MIRTFILAVQTAPANTAGMNLWDMVVMGDWLMIPIFILSVIIIYIACERFWLIRKTGLTDVPFMENIQEIAQLCVNYDLQNLFFVLGSVTTNG